MNPTRSSAAQPAPEPFVIVNDFRDTPRPKGTRGAAIRTRPVKDIVGITLHQTATRDFPSDHRGLINVPAHAMVHRDGSVSLLHHPTTLVYHGNALNNGTIGIEIACRAAGTEGDASTFWRSTAERGAGEFYADLVAEATDAQLAAARELCRQYIAEVSALGGAIRGIWAHRQGHSSRTSDPGSRIWKGVAEQVRLDLGLADVRDLTLGSGKPIPASWRSEL
jgi:N-acetyl-anhydromuramyl-L-alanine amidase AmpD